MLSYDTCVKLKDAGFPYYPMQTTDSYYISPAIVIDGSRVRGGAIRDTNGLLIGSLSLVRIPAFSELIEACEGNIYSISHNPEWEGYEWRVNPNDHHTMGSEPDAIGKTLEEAVANLYLLLRENQKTDNS